MDAVLSIPPELVTLGWWTIASLVVIAVGVSAVASLVKSLLRFARPQWKDTVVEKLILRASVVLLGAAAAAGCSTVYPFDAMPWPILLALGAFAGANSEVVYRWGLQHVEGLVDRLIGK